jgi:signal peptidase I
MSSSSGNGDSPAAVAGGPRPGAAADSGRHAPGEAAGRAPTRLPQELDYRLRGLGTLEPDHVPVTPTRTDHHQHRRGPFLAKAIAFLAVAALAVPLLQHFVIQPFAMPGNAMSPALQAGDRVLVLKSSLLEGPLRSGEIVVFRPQQQSLPCSVVGGHSGDLVLRIVALPGETIRSAGETIFVNGQPLSERGWYDPRFGQVGSTPIRSTTLAPGQYFVLADNRSDACDSRAFGPISQSSVVGEAIAIVGRHGHVYFGTP